MPIKEDREYRSMEMRILNAEEENGKSYYVEGYASTFDPYVLFNRDGVDYSERIDPAAFDEADLSDVVFRVDHTGAVYARSSAGTVDIWHDEHGLGARGPADGPDSGRVQRCGDQTRGAGLAAGSVD